MMKLGNKIVMIFPNMSKIYLISDFQNPGKTDIIVFILQKKEINQRGCHTLASSPPGPLD